MPVREKQQHLCLVSLSPHLVVLKVVNGLRRSFPSVVHPLWPNAEPHLDFRLVQKLFDVDGLRKEVVHADEIELQVFHYALPSNTLLHRSATEGDSSRGNAHHLIAPHP